MPAPKGNQNAKGHGAPKENKNAQTHGAYAAPDESAFTEDERAQVQCAAILGDTLGKLTAKRIDLEKKMAALESDAREKYDTTGADTISGGKRQGSAVYWESKFQRMEKLETQYNRTLGNIIKAVEAIRKGDLEQQRMGLERERLRLAREKAMGIFGEDE